MQHKHYLNRVHPIFPYDPNSSLTIANIPTDPYFVHTVGAAPLNEIMDNGINLFMGSKLFRLTSLKLLLNACLLKSICLLLSVGLGNLYVSVPK